MKPFIKKFLFPEINRRYLIRLAIVAASAYILFGYATRPFWVRGVSMEPTYHNGRVVWGSRFRYAFRDLKRGDVVMIKLAGPSVMYMKRVIGLAGETVELRKGKLFINGAEQDEPWLNLKSDWTRPPQVVEPGFVFVIGDNRSMPIDQHVFGVVLEKRIYGGPLW